MKWIMMMTVLFGLAFSQIDTHSIVAAPPAISFEWIGGPTYVLHLGSFTILTDPMFSAKGDSAFLIPKHPTTGAVNAPIKRLFAPATFDYSHLDLLLISHPHADHVDKEARAALDKGVQVVGPAVNTELITGWGFTNFAGLNWGDQKMLKKGDEMLSINAVEARHAAEEPLRTQLGKGNGYVITYQKGGKVYRIYWTGDTVWFDEIAGVARFGHINLLVPDMGAVGSDGPIGRRGLNSGDCLKIVDALHPDKIIPVHHSTFSMYVEPISVLQQTVDSSAYRGRLMVPEVGVIVNM
jgi:N-acyl-phosphatidylethanolamine-hydrolysing phospholipase D